MIKNTIKFDFNQIEKALLGFAVNLEYKLKTISDNLPTFILQTGDTSYLLDKKFVETSGKEIYDKTPRFVIGIEDIQLNTEENTNPYNKFYYLFEEVNYFCSARRMAINLAINTDYVSPNFIAMLQNFEIMLTIISKPNVFTYEFLGSTFEASYTSESNGVDKPVMDIGSGTKNFSVKTGLQLQLQLIVPRIETIKLKANEGLNNVFDIVENSNELQTNLDTTNN